MAEQFRLTEPKQTAGLMGKSGIQRIGPLSGRQSGWAESESGKRFEVFETPEKPMDSRTRGLQDRTSYRQSLVEKLGNPDTSEADISSQVSGDMRRDEAALFDYVFGGRRDFNTRDTMEPRARNLWRKANEQYRKKRETAIRNDLKTVTKRVDAGMKAYDVSAKAKTGLTRSQQINLRQDIYKAKKAANKVYEKDILTQKPIKPEKAKEMPKYNRAMQAWTLGKIAHEYGEVKPYSIAVYGENSGEAVDQEYGNKVYRDYSKIKDEPEKEAYLTYLRNTSPDLYEILKNIARGATGISSPIKDRGGSSGTW